MKYAITVILTAIVVGLGVTAYFKGWLPTVSFQKPQAVSVQNTEVAVSPTQAPIATDTATPSAATTLIKAGGILSMSKYSINIPKNWQSSKDGSVAGQTDTLTLTNGSYKIIISQGAFGGGGCVYPGDPDIEMSQRFTGFTALTDASNDNLRLGTIQSGGMAVCQENGGGWGDITSFGHISVAASSPEVISILSSLKKI